MARQKPPARPAAPDQAVAELPDKLALVLTRLDSIEERVRQMGLDLQAIKDGIAYLGDQVGQAAAILADQQGQQQEVDELAASVQGMNDQLAAVLPPGPGPESAPAPAAPPAGATPQQPAAPTAQGERARKAQEMADLARSRRQPQAPRVG